jgi:hypothetical protein
MHTRRALIRRPQIYSSPELTPANNQGQQLHTLIYYTYSRSAPKLQLTRAHSLLSSYAKYGGAVQKSALLSRVRTFHNKNSIYIFEYFYISIRRPIHEKARAQRPPQQMLLA